MDHSVRLGHARLARALRPVLLAQARELRSRVTTDHLLGYKNFDLTHWVKILAAAARVPYARAWQAGAFASATRIGNELARRTRRPVKLLQSKSLGGVVLKAAGVREAEFDITSPRVLDAVDQAVLQFCRETNETATLELKEALRKLRKLLKGSLAAGDALAALQKKVMRIFADPYRAWRIAATECVTGDSIVCGANVLGVYRRWYKGPMVQVVTENGFKLTGTAHHPMLTRRGWVFLGDLQKTDDLVCDGGLIKRGLSTPRYENKEAPPVSFDEIFDSLSTVGVKSRVRCGNPDFHGDGLDGYVDVLDSRSVLRYGRVASSDQLVQNGFFTPADTTLVALVSEGALSGSAFPIDQSHSVFSASQTDPRFEQDFLDFSSTDFESTFQTDGAFTTQVIVNQFLFGDRQRLEPRMVFFPPRKSRVGSLGGSSSHSCFPTGRHDNGGVTTEMRGDHLAAAPVPVHFDRLKSLCRIESWFGHVYNLSTLDGHYNVNGLYTKNSSRAYNGGQFMAAKDSGLVAGKRWMASGNACDACLALDGVEKPLDESFIVLPKGGPYAVIMYPPYHPACQCSWSEVLGGPGSLVA